ncbi:MAG: hypothetical protein AAGD43_33945, partial [Pseudomonadota bacterium]
MVEAAHPSHDTCLTLVEPDERVVALARMLEVNDPQANAALMERTQQFARFGQACTGQALYRHRSVYQRASDAPFGSHVELSYFRDVVPTDALRELLNDQQPEGSMLLRAELLLTTPSSFILPHGWQGSGDRPELQASLEFIHVEPRHLGKYRGVMRDYCGPAAQKLVRAKTFGTFRAMETAAVLYQAPSFSIDWNQLHICELEPEGFDGFGKAFGDA